MFVFYPQAAATRDLEAKLAAEKEKATKVCVHAVIPSIASLCDALKSSVQAFFSLSLLSCAIFFFGGSLFRLFIVSWEALFFLLDYFVCGW